ncbi:MAG: redox-regulated ATPase YchF, partial [Chloroflexi bacterium]|nr:redox-regulated ATPase YchF [Chloroflexota bacterium]
MEIAIIGLPQSGKTTVFSALTGIKVDQAARGDHSIGIVKVPDQRLPPLADLFKPHRVVPAEIAYIDYGAFVKGFGKAEAGLTPQFLSQLARADAIIHVVRVFQDDRVPHIEGSVDPKRDIASMDLELAFADMAFIERRLERMETSLKAAKPQEREAAHAEQQLLARMKDRLEDNVPVSEQELTLQERKLIENYQFITAHPMLNLLNYGEGQEAEAQA